ncbi:hypothetical protein OH76DRAFT_611411 [Lentinus brumalis]|uniref:Uncharacterized protein n=1 Tax=Lentinus brumalis TaxID=2498619 RepID=A0A371DV03_9APHY|nr:hypothetical protein OH76DRAFT_611411 [Polyporus brumalis]
MSVGVCLACASRQSPEARRLPTLDCPSQPFRAIVAQSRRGRWTVASRSPITSSRVGRCATSLPRIPMPETAGNLPLLDVRHDPESARSRLCRMASKTRRQRAPVRSRSGSSAASDVARSAVSRRRGAMRRLRRDSQCEGVGICARTACVRLPSLTDTASIWSAAVVLVEQSCHCDR